MTKNSFVVEVTFNFCSPVKSSENLWFYDNFSENRSFLLKFADYLKQNLEKIPHYIWVKVFENGPNKSCGRQPLKNLK